MPTLTPDQVAERVNLDRSNVVRRCQQGRVPGAYLTVKGIEKPVWRIPDSPEAIAACRPLYRLKRKQLP